MKLEFIDSSADWNQPIFKVLANNDTGAAPGHQAGVVIPKTLRNYFPALAGAVSAVQPTVDKRLKAQLFIEESFLGTVSTRYQYQTWSNTRSPESRLTDQLKPLRDLATGGDILIIHRSAQRENEYKLTLVRKSSAAFRTIARAIGTRRWGKLRP